MGNREVSGGLHGLLKARRDVLLSCWMKRAQASVAPGNLTPVELLDRMPAFVDQIIAALAPKRPPPPDVSTEAEEHGAQRLRLGFDVTEVIREYGLLHDCVLALARDAHLSIDLRDLGILAQWLNTGIADAVGQYIRERDRQQQRQASEHLGFIAHELRNPLAAALMALQRLRLAELAPGGGTVDLLERNLRRTSQMVESALVTSSLEVGVEARREKIDIPEFLREIERDATLEAQAKKIAIVTSTPQDLIVEADPRLLRSALMNLVTNAVKFSRRESSIELAAARDDGQLVIEVADACGGLPPGKAEELFRPHVQRGENRSGFGLGLAIALQAAQAHAGSIALRDMPGQGCVFSIVLPLVGTPPGPASR